MPVLRRSRSAGQDGGGSVSWGVLGSSFSGDFTRRTVGIHNCVYFVMIWYEKSRNA